MREYPPERLHASTAQIEDWLSRPLPSTWPEALRSLQLPSCNGTILDCGCGPGIYGRFLAADGATVIGVDRERRCLAAASRRKKAYTGLAASLVEDLPFRRDSFDLVLLRYVLHHVGLDMRQRALAGLRDVVQHRGWLVVETCFRDQMLRHFDHRIYPRLNEVASAAYPDRRTLRRLLKEAGFSVWKEEAIVEVRPPHRTVAEALRRSSELTSRGRGPTAWLQLSQRERQRFHELRAVALPELFGHGPVPRVWHSTFIVAVAE